MSKLEELIAELCPNGVEHRTLGSLGKFYGGLTGKSKEDFKDGNARFITYRNVYSNPALNLTTIYHQCGLCELGRKLGHSELIPHMCQMDYISVDMMGGVLHRTKTLASGGDCCDFYVCKKGSKWDTAKKE